MTRDIECIYKEVGFEVCFKGSKRSWSFRKKLLFGGKGGGTFCLMLSFRLCCVKMFLSKLLFLICVDVLQDIAQSKPFPPCEEFFSNITPSLILELRIDLHIILLDVHLSSFFTLLFGKRLERLSHGLTSVYNLHALSSFLYCAIP